MPFCGKGEGLYFSSVPETLKRVPEVLAMRAIVTWCARGAAMLRPYAELAGDTAVRS